MRAAMSGAFQCLRRSASTASSAPAKVPSGFAFRGQMCPLSRWVCMSTKHGHTMPRSRSNLGRVVRLPGASIRSIPPSRTVMSAATRPSASALALKPSTSTAGSVAFWRTYRFSRGILAKPFATTSILPADGTLVPFPQQEVRDDGGHAVDGDAGQREKYEGREQARNVQPVLRLDQAEGEAG